MKLPTAKYEVFMQKNFYRLGLSIGKHPWKYIIALLICTALSSVGFLRFHQVNNARITFTDSEAPSRYEGRVLEKFLEQNGTLHMIEVMISSSDNGSLLRPDRLKQLDDLSNEISNVLSVKNADDQPLTFRNMCEPYCQKNDAFFAVMKLMTGNVSSFDITYPVMDILGNKVFLGNNFYRVQKNDTTGGIQDFRTIILHYFLVHKEMNMMIKWEEQVVRLCYESDKYHLLRASVASDNLVAKEVKKMGTETAPLLTIALAALMFFLTMSSFRYRRRESKPLEAMLGGATPLLATVTTIGLVSATGLAFQSIVVSTMFLLLAIGIDDVFIMLAAWHRTDKNKEIPVRMAEMVREAGCSMTVTTVTNFVSFGNGVLSTTPVLQTFAIYSTVASVVCYLYQLILFPSILSITAHKEYKQKDENCRACIPEKIELIGQASEFHDTAFKWLAKICCTWWMRVITILALIAYWGLSVHGVLIVKTELGIQHLAPPKARITKFKAEYDEIIKDMQTVAIVVQHPGDLTKRDNLDKIKSLIEEFETAPHSYGHDSTFCWIPEYEDYLKFYEMTEDEDAPVPFTYLDLPDFVKSDSNSHFKGTIKMNATACHANTSECVSSFLFTTAFTGVSAYNEMYFLIEEWRAIASKYPELGVISYTERHNFADQTNALESVIWQTLASEVLCMGLTFIFFIPDTVSIVAGMFALVSVNLGVFGFLSLWGVGINPFSMASLLMSIGFSVDISAHISYHYYEQKAPTPRAKLEQTFLHIGWPTIQGAMSTLLAMVFILVKPSYLGMVFLKTVTLVMVFGLLHGLIILPVFLSFFNSVFRRHDRVTVGDAIEHSKGIQPHRITVKSITAMKDEHF